MEQLITSEVKLGLIAGGQLAKLLTTAAYKWDIDVKVLDPSTECPASTAGAEVHQGNINNYEDVLKFGELVDMIILEIEHVNVKALFELKKKGKLIFPSPEILEIIQDKGAQKQFLKSNGFPTSDFRLYESRQDLLDAMESGKEKIPFVQKSRTMGYDGQGVYVAKSESSNSNLLDANCLVEDFVQFEKEISVIVARNASGEIKCFPCVEMTFYEGANLVDQLICPANIPHETSKKAENLAIEIAKKINLEGILAIEMFLLKDGDIMINEMAPRPHNSGHQTIEACVTSQYEQLIRAAFNFSLGSTGLHCPSIMINLLGEKGHTGLAKFEGLEEIMGLEGVSVHIYGKKETRPMRKMGHATILNKDIESAQATAQLIKDKLKVVSWKNH